MLTKWQSFVSGKPRNYPEMWAKLAAVLGSVQTPAQYEAAEKYTWLWYDRITANMSFGRTLKVFFDLSSMLTEVRFRVGVAKKSRRI